MLDLLPSLLTPTIAVVTAYIAYQQYRIRRDERNLVMYDRRLSVFKNAISVIDKVHAGLELKPHEAITWLSSVSEAQFLFGDEVQTILDELYGRVYEYSVEAESKNPNAVPFAQAALSVEEMRTPLVRVFIPYLRPVGTPNKRVKRLTADQALSLIPKSSAKRENVDTDIPF